MKTVYLASSLAILASAAHAEVTLSGDARLGIVSPFGGTQSVTSRARVTFDLVGDSDGGLSYGATFRADNAADAAAGKAGSVYISGAFGKFSLGDVDGAAETIVGNLDGVGLTGLGDLNNLIFPGSAGYGNVFAARDGIFYGPTSKAITLTGNPSALYEFSAGPVGLAASTTQAGFLSDFVWGGNTQGFYEGRAQSIAVRYGTEAFSVALGYDDMRSILVLGGFGGGASLRVAGLTAGGNVTLSGVTVKARYGAFDMVANGNPVAVQLESGLSASYSIDALTLTAFGQKQSFQNVSGSTMLETKSLGFGAEYDLGPGVTFASGWARKSERDLTGSEEVNTAFDLGLKFGF